MKEYIITLKIKIHSESDNVVINKANKIVAKIRNEVPITEIDSIKEFRFLGLNNRFLNIKNS